MWTPLEQLDALTNAFGARTCVGSPHLAGQLLQLHSALASDASGR